MERYLIAMLAVPALLGMWILVERIASRGRPPEAGSGCPSCGLRGACRRER
jgi:hypothetical protein